MREKVSPKATDEGSRRSRIPFSTTNRTNRTNAFVFFVRFVVNNLARCAARAPGENPSSDRFAATFSRKGRWISETHQ